jgi:cytochrome P450
MVRTLEDATREAAKVLVDALPLDTPVDIVPPLAVALPVQVIAQLLGLPESQWDRVWEWSEASIPGTEIYNDAERKNALNAEMYTELLRLVEVARETPGDDVISLLAGIELDGDRLSNEELRMFLNQLLVAGNETTRNTISGGLVAFAQNPEEWDRLRADRSLINSAVEEILRWTTAVIYFVRTATKDTVLGGQKIGAGEALMMLYASANRDESEFGPTADRFDIGRTPNHHVAFGFGVHFCLGAALARLEVAAVLDALLDRGVTRLELVGEVGVSASNIIAGITDASVILHTT